MAIVEEVDGDQNLHAVVTKADAQVVVTSLTGPRVPPEYQRLLFGSRCMALVTISRDARYAAVYDRKVLREVAVEQLAQAIREVAQQRDVPGVSDKLM